MLNKIIFATFLVLSIPVMSATTLDNSDTKSGLSKETKGVPAQDADQKNIRAYEDPAQGNSTHDAQKNKHNQSKSNPDNIRTGDKHIESKPVSPK